MVFFCPLPSPFMPVPVPCWLGEIYMWVIRVNISAETKQIYYASAGLILICLKRVWKDGGFLYIVNTYLRTLTMCWFHFSLGTGRHIEPSVPTYIKIVVPKSISRSSIYLFSFGWKQSMQTSIVNELEEKKFRRKNSHFWSFCYKF